MKYLTNYVPQETGGMSAGYVVVEDNGVLKAQKLSFDGTTPQFDGVAEEITDVGIFETGLDEPAYNGGGGGKFYKCASVDTDNKTWSGHELVLQDGVYIVSETLTDNLNYTYVTPEVGCYYSADATLSIQDPTLVSPTNMASSENDEWLITDDGHAVPAYYAFNGATFNYKGWQTDDYGSLPAWMQWQNKKRKARIMSYSIQCSSDAPERGFPRTWELQGSDDGSSWATVDQRIDFYPEQINNLQHYTFECQNPGSYYCYRLYVTSERDPSFCYVMVGQFRAYGQFE